MYIEDFLNVGMTITVYAYTFRCVEITFLEARHFFPSQTILLL